MVYFEEGSVVIRTLTQICGELPATSSPGSLVIMTKEPGDEVELPDLTEKTSSYIVFRQR